MTKFNTLLKSTVLAAVAATAIISVSPAANAATSVKPTVTAKGKVYYNTKKAENSAKYRWSLKAAAKYGPSYGHWGKAKGKSMQCHWVTQKIGANGLTKFTWRCLAKAKPARTIKLCKSPVKAKGMFYTTKSKAKSSSAYRWGLKTASIYGASFAQFGKAKGKSYQCNKANNKGLWNCTVKAKPCK